MRSQRGFTLLELLVAMVIMAVVLSAVYITQSSSLYSSVRTKNVVIATNLARNFINETDRKIEGQSFDSLSPTEEGEFPEPYKSFKWKREVAEVDFSALTQVLTNQMSSKDNQLGVSQEQTTMVSFFQDYLKKSIRKLTITVQWQESGAPATISFTSFLVNYDANFGP